MGDTVYAHMLNRDMVKKSMIPTEKLVIAHPAIGENPRQSQRRSIIAVLSIMRTRRVLQVLRSDVR